MFHSYDEEAEREQNKLDAELYRKLRNAMGFNMESTWKEICNLAAIACYVNGVENFDQYLDGLDFVAISRSK